MKFCYKASFLVDIIFTQIFTKTSDIFQDILGLNETRTAIILQLLITSGWYRIYLLLNVPSSIACEK